MNGGGHLGTVLLEEGLITEDVLSRAIESTKEKDQPLGRVLVDEGFLPEADLVRALARHIGIEFVDLSEITVDPAAASLIPDSLARRYAALPIGFDGEKLVIAMADPGNVLAVDDIRAISGMEVITRVATRSDVDNALSRLAGLDDSVTDLAEMAADGVEQEDLGAVESAADEAPVIKLVNTLITRAAADRASDIHIEPNERDLLIRYRIDGVLHELMRTPRSIARAVVSRLKIMADIDIAERRRPQDGRISLRVSGKQIDLRVSTLPTIYGEKVVMRILDSSTAMLTLTDLDFLPDTAERYEESYTKPYGTILVTGPTGSEKSTTLYATLNVINKPQVNIITVEDPVEYRLSGINQVQVNKKAGHTLAFSSALRHVLRQDPDVILVGEIRDLEPISTALTAAETGHLVFATLHTQDAPQSIDRVIDVFPPHQQHQVRTQLASSLQAVVTQQLVPTRDGKGRAVAAEILIATPAIRHLIRDGKVHQITTAMQAGGVHGMVTMDHSLADLVQRNAITYELGVERCANVEDFQRLCDRE